MDRLQQTMAAAPSRGAPSCRYDVVFALQKVIRTMYGPWRMMLDADGPDCGHLGGYRALVVTR